MKKRRDPRINVALARGLEILRAFRPEEVQLGNIDIAKRTGIPKGTVSRLTYTLTAFGYLRSSEVTGMFSIGPGILALGYPVLVNNAIHLAARPLMEKLALETNSAVGFGVRDGSYVIHLEYAKGTTAAIRDIAAGFRVSIAGSATGWACLAGMRRDERAAALKQIKAELDPKQYRGFEAKLGKAMKEVWAQGFCVSFGDVDPAFNAVAAPFMHEGRRESYVVNCIGPAYLFKRSRMVEEVGPRLVRLTEELRRRSAPLYS